MAITNAQQFKQLVNPPMEGKKRPGYRGDVAYGGGDQVAGGGDQDFGGNDPPGPDRSKISAAQEANQKAQVRAGNVRAVENFINRPTFGFTDAAKFNIAPAPLKFLSGIFSGGTGKVTPPTPIGGGGSDVSQAMVDIPTWMRLGFSSEAEYLASLEDEEDKKEDEGLRLAFRADGGPIGGEYDFESARQMYGLGKLVKKVTRTVKKIAKSPIGKAAIAYGIGFGIPGTSFGGLLGSSAGSMFGARQGLFGTYGPVSALKNLGIMKSVTDAGAAATRVGPLANLGVGSLIVGSSLLAGLLTAKQEEEAQELSRGEGIDIDAARRSILARAQGNVAGDRRATAFLAEGGKPEPVAKKTMPLLDMDGQEMDLREEGGFVPIGRMEKADDVPARLSKNEFVFTADAVRNAGDGDVDKGAEVMYNMMKNLEAGGEVSEESQGLEGARNMFQTSQRLEEVL